MHRPSIVDLIRRQLEHDDGEEGPDDAAEEILAIDDLVADPEAPAPARAAPAARGEPAAAPGRSRRGRRGGAGARRPPAPEEDTAPAEPLAPPARAGAARGAPFAGEAPAAADEDALALAEPFAHEPPTRRERGEGRLPEGFAAIGLGEPLLRALRHAGFEAPTPIQERAIPEALAGRDVIGQAKTGTGKTAAFGLPILSRTRAGGGTRALVVTPTRELALQVRTELERLGRYTSLRTAAIYGGVPLEGQRRALAEKREVLVGTPGRLLDHARRGSLDLGEIEIVVLDECDRMFDLGFRPDIERILRGCTGRKQLLLFSATVGEDVLRLAARYTENPVELYTAPETLTVDAVTQSFLSVAKDRKVSALVALIRRENPKQAIIFCRTKIGCEKLAKRLHAEGVTAEELHGDLRQEKRERILRKVRDGEVTLLVATDVAARGLDIPTITHIFNYDIPEYPEDYVHRIGRTARMGAVGCAITLVEPGQGRLLTEIEKLTNVEVKEIRVAGVEPPGPAAGPEAPKPRQTGTGEILFSNWTPKS
jgi:ATP-dependent RNA helicase DeaD